MTRLTTADITPARLSEFHALEPIPEERRGALLQQAQIRRLGPGEVLLRARMPADTSLFLIQGEFEVQESASVRYKLYAGGAQARHALEERLGASASLRAIGEVSMLAIERRLIEEAISNRDQEAFTIEYAPVSIREAPRVEKKTVEDWSTRLRNSTLLSAMPAADVLRFFMELERVELRAGDDIVNVGGRNDYFHVLFEGSAELSGDPAGIGAALELVPGSHFGAEAMIGGTPSNVTVRMKTAGALGRIGKQQFDRILRPVLVPVADPDTAAGLLDDSGMRCELLDIRPAQESAGARRDGALGLSVESLRDSLHQLAAGSTFLVAPEGGQHAELGVFLLRQAGRDAYLLSD